MELSLKKKKLPRKKTKLSQKVKLFFQFRKSFSFVFSFMKSKEVGAIKKIFFIGLTIAYVVFPIDVIPEVILGPLGLVDDASVIAFLLNWMVEAAPRSLREQYKLN
ncbi:DUF1232 domain-containing protein [Priestia filamentosa]|uniref:YkvA family protein n=1 Tax=Priestia filamentosa TaxID=1402861 RepID=UPI00068B3E88